MPFEPILPPRSKEAAPAVISVRWRRDRLLCIVTLRRALIDEAGLTPAQRIEIARGVGDDAGKLRLKADDGGAYAARQVRAGSLQYEFLAPHEFGGEERTAEAADARWDACAGAIFVDLPQWGDAPLQRPARLPVQPKPDEKAKPDVAKPRAATRAAKGDTVNGVTIDLTDGAECIGFAGKTVSVPARQARMVALLARPRPSPVALSFLVGALWDGRPPGTAGEAVKQMAAELQIALAKIGLDLRVVKGLGYQLKDL